MYSMILFRSYSGYGILLISLFIMNLIQVAPAGIPGAGNHQPSAPSVELNKNSTADNRSLPQSVQIAPNADKISAIDDATTITKLSLKAVWEIALKLNPTFTEFSASRDRAHAAVMEARAWRNPEFDSEMRFRNGNGTDNEYELTMQQPIEIPGKRRARRDAAAALESVADKEEISFMVTLRGEVIKAYWTVKYRERTIDLAAQNFALAQEIVVIVNKRVDAGSGRPIDITRAEVEKFKAKKSLQSERRLLNLAHAALNAWCGNGLPDGFQLADDLPTQNKTVDIDSLRVRALLHHPELQRLQALKHLKERELARERCAWYPDIIPGLGYAQEGDTDNFIIRIGVEVPFWNKNRGVIARAQADLRHLEAQLIQLNQTIIRDLAMTKETYAWTIEQISACEEIRAAAAAALKTETFLYEQGEVDFISLLDVRRTAQETEAEYLAALYEAQLALLELEKTIGITGVNE